MVFYFSGTGNSLWVAKELGKSFDEMLISIADELKKNKETLTYEVGKNEKIFFIFPVHSWGPAVLMLPFIQKMQLKGYTNQAVYTLCVCGDNCGHSDKIISKELAKKNIIQTKAYSIQMPNNYILMKGFGIDPKEVEKEKLVKAPVLVKEIIDDINAENHKEIYVRGGKPFLKSKIVYPLFRKFAIGRNKFFATDDCTSCGLCEEVCPTDTISLINDKPVWKNTCVQCTACIHRCPVQAIEYGNITQTQGRYFHPSL